jgi:hypothetical protein
MNIKHLCIIFGSTPNVCLGAICKLLKRITCKLIDHPFAKVQFLTKQEMAELTALVHSQELFSPNVI